MLQICPKHHLFSKQPSDTECSASSQGTSAVESLPGKLGLVVMRRYIALSWLEANLLHPAVRIRDGFCEASYPVGRKEVVEQVWIHGENKSRCYRGLK